MNGDRYKFQYELMVVDPPFGVPFARRWYITFVRDKHSKEVIRTIEHWVAAFIRPKPKYLPKLIWEWIVNRVVSKWRVDLLRELE